MLFIQHYTYTMPKHDCKRKNSFSLLHIVSIICRDLFFLSLYPDGLLLARYAGLFIPMLPYCKHESCLPISFQANERSLFYRKHRIILRSLPLRMTQYTTHVWYFLCSIEYLIFLICNTYLIFLRNVVDEMKSFTLVNY